MPGWRLLKESTQSMPRLIAAALLASLIFAACTAGQGPSTVAVPTAAFQADRSEGMQSQASTRQPEAETTPRPTATPSTATPSTAPEPTVAAESPPTPRIEITLTSIPVPTGIPIAGQHALGQHGGASPSLPKNVAPPTTRITTRILRPSNPGSWRNWAASTDPTRARGSGA